MVLQRTRYERLQRQLGDQVQPVVDGPWKRRSLGALSLLLGFFLGSNLTTYYLEKIGQRPVVVLVLVLLIEVVVRMRTRVQSLPLASGLGFARQSAHRCGLRRGAGGLQTWLLTKAFPLIHPLCLDWTGGCSGWDGVPVIGLRSGSPEVGSTWRPTPGHLPLIPDGSGEWGFRC